MKREVIGCVGGGGNHLRWLLLLDPQFPHLQGHRGPSHDTFSFIVNNVYPEDRNWQNWLNYEWRWRLEVDHLIAFSHGRALQRDTRYCALVTSPDDAFKHYVKFNTNLNNTLVETFKQQIGIYNNSFRPADNLLIIDGSKLFQPILDIELYNKVIEWFELSDNYAQAAEIHSLWWKLVKRAEQEIIQDLQKIYS